MNRDFRIKLLQNIFLKKTHQGFTLIELLVVVLIIGVLAAIALPNLLGQVAKGRQAEAKNNLGAINRGQQAYSAEKGVFVSLLSPNLAVKISPQYYSYADGLGGVNGTNATYASFTAIPNSTYASDIKNYASAVNADSTGNFAIIICESIGTATANGAVVPSGGNSSAAALTCTTGVQIN